MQRLFFALEMPEPVRQALLCIKAPVDGARWQSDGQLHLTLLFLGNVQKETVPGIGLALRDLSLPPFDLHVRGLGCFGQPETPRNLWAGVTPEAPLIALHATLKERLNSLGFSFEKRPFRPHITLARFKKQRGSVQSLLAEHGEDEFGAVTVRDFVLLQSTQGVRGSDYTVVERFPLTESP
ncbi:MULTISPECIES: RNA 2',3'-cyclic phosphodiesterase [Marinobacter]|jgi:2'-5' RNA ligase|uniref:RNA 2',3'-cyclic phosphodiesterase n=1 Tax=Marinobacter TaxID=2742 RepID=UPI00110964D4|nr:MULTISPECIES: RNA 2',3'-cyclic phosphodiesterase [Marinobacter]